MATALNRECLAEWRELDGVREAVAELLREAGIERASVDAVTMVACELCENAIKYGRFTSGGRFSLSVTVQTAGILVEVRNPVDPDNYDDMRRLDRMVQWIRGFQDPFEAYVNRLRVVSALRIDDRESGLGLARIAYEGQAILDFFVDEHDTLWVSAFHAL